MRMCSWMVTRLISTRGAPLFLEYFVCFLLQMRRFNRMAQTSSSIRVQSVGFRLTSLSMRVRLVSVRAASDPSSAEERPGRVTSPSLADRRGQL